MALREREHEMIGVIRVHDGAKITPLRRRFKAPRGAAARDGAA
jgi:hypothetical protein